MTKIAKIFKISQTLKYPKLQNIQNSKIYNEYKVQERWLDLQALQGSEAPRSLQPAVASKIKQSWTKQSKVELNKAKQSKAKPSKARKKQSKARICTACILGVVFWRWSKAECNLWEREQHRWPWFCQTRQGGCSQSKATCCCSLTWSSSPW